MKGTEHMGLWVGAPAWFKLLQGPVVWVVLAGGFVLGSFFNVLIHRLPRGTFWASAWSQCFHCEARLMPWHNIPLLSYLLLRGRSACCHRRLPLRYPVIELLAGAISVFLYLRYPFLGAGGAEWWPLVAVRFAHLWLFCASLLVCSVIDLEHMMIPDRISWPMIVLGPICALQHPELGIRDALWGVILGGGLVWSISRGYFLVRGREGLGLGDAKLCAWIGGWLGWQAVLPTLLVGSVLGSVAVLAITLLGRPMRLDTEIPFGPFLALGAIFFAFAPTSLLMALF